MVKAPSDISEHSEKNEIRIRKSKCSFSLFRKPRYNSGLDLLPKHRLILTEHVRDLYNLIRADRLSQRLSSASVKDKIYKWIWMRN